MTRKLLFFNTANPPGNEEEIARFVGGRLAGHGFKIEYPVFTSENDPFIQIVYDVCKVERMRNRFTKALPYMTAGSVLQKLYNNAFAVVPGPG